MVHIVDLGSTGSNHLLFNISMIKVLIEVFPFENFTFYAEREHQNLVSTYFTSAEREKFSFRQIASNPKSSSRIGKTINGLWRTTKDSLFFTRLLWNVSKASSDVIFLCTAHALSFLSLKYLKKLYPKVKVISTLHGETEYLYYAKNKWEKDMSYLYTRIFQCKSPNFIYLTLNKISKRTLIADGYLTSEEVMEIDHPYIYSDLVATNTSQENSVVTIGHVGSLGVRKNAHLIYELAAKFQNQIDPNKPCFWAIGPIEDNALPFKNQFVTDFVSQTPGQYISRDTFEKKIRKIDYAIFFYSPEQFIYRASGAVQDVINYNKPMIVLKHPYFDYLFEVAGNIGFICEDLGEMYSVIFRITNNDENLIRQYKRQIENITAYKKRSNIKSIAIDFEHQMSVLLK